MSKFGGKLGEVVDAAKRGLGLTVKDESVFKKKQPPEEEDVVAPAEPEEPPAEQAVEDEAEAASAEELQRQPIVEGGKNLKEAFGGGVDTPAVRDALHPEQQPVTDEQSQAAMNVSRVDQFVDPSRTDTRNSNLKSWNSTEDILKAWKSIEAQPDEPVVFEELPADIQEHLMLNKYVDQLSQAKGDQIGAKSKNVQPNRVTMSKVRKAIGEAQAIWLDNEKNNPRSPINNLQHKFLREPDLPEAVKWRARLIEARNATLELTDILKKDDGLISKFANKKRGEWSLVEIQSAKKLLVRGSVELFDEAVAMENKGTYTEMEIWNLNKMLANYSALQRSFEGGVNEAARIVQAQKIPIGSTKFMMDEVAYRVDSMGGRSRGEQMVKTIIAGRGDALYNASLANKVSASNIFDALYEHYISQGIFFDPTVHFFNIVGSSAHTVMNLGAAWAAPLTAKPIRQIRHILRGGIKRNSRGMLVKEPLPDSSSLGEAEAYTYGLATGMRDMWGNFLKGYKAGLNSGHSRDNPDDVGVPQTSRFIETAASHWNNSLLGLPENSILGKGINLYGKYAVRPGRGMIMGIDQVYRMANKTAQRNRLIYRHLVNDEGMSPYSSEFKKRSKSIADGTDEQYSRLIDDEATDYASRLVFQDRSNGIIMNTVRQANRFWGVRYLTMFAQTVDNMFWAAVEFTPATFVSKKIQADWAKGGAEREIVMAKAGLGMAYLVSVVLPSSANEQLDANGNTVRTPLIATGGESWKQKRIQQMLGFKVGHLNIAMRDENGVVTSYLPIETNRIGSAASSAFMMHEANNMIQAIRNPDHQRDLMTSLAIAVGDMFGHYSALAAFGEIGMMAEGRISPTKSWTSVVSTFTPLGQSSGTSNRIRVWRDPVKRATSLNLDVPLTNTQRVFEQFNLVAAEIMLKANNRMSAEQAKVLNIINPFSGELFTGSEQISPIITPYGSAEFYNTPAYVSENIPGSAWAMGEEWEDWREPVVLTAAFQAGYYPSNPEKTFEYRIPDLNKKFGIEILDVYKNKVVRLNLDLIDMNHIQKLKKEGNEVWKKLSPNDTYTSWAKYAGKHLLDAHWKVVNSKDYAESLIRNNGYDDHGALFSAATSQSRLEAKELWLKDNEYVEGLLLKEALRRMSEMVGEPYTVPKGMHGIELTPKKEDGADELDVMKKRIESNKLNKQEVEM